MGKEANRQPEATTDWDIIDVTGGSAPAEPQRTTGDHALWLPAIDAKAGNVVCWSVEDIGIWPHEVAAFGDWLRQRTAELDRATLNIMRDERTRHGNVDHDGDLGRKYGIEPRPGDTALSAQWTQRELDAEHACRPPKQGWRWLCEVGYVGAPTPPPTAENGADTSAPLAAIVADASPGDNEFFGADRQRPRIITGLERKSLSDLIDAGAMSGPLLVVPSKGGYFIRLNVPIQRDQGKGFEVDPNGEEVIVFFAGDRTVGAAAQLGMAAARRVLAAEPSVRPIELVQGQWSIKVDDTSGESLSAELGQTLDAWAERFSPLMHANRVDFGDRAEAIWQTVDELELEERTVAVTFPIAATFYVQTGISEAA